MLRYVGRAKGYVTLARYAIGDVIAQWLERLPGYQKVTSELF
jgi:hypothetical protein